MAPIFASIHDGLATLTFHLLTASVREVSFPAADPTCSPARIGSLGRSVIERMRWKVKVRSEISWRRRHSGWPPQNITHCQTRITAHGTTDLAGRMRCTISPHGANHLAAAISFGVVRRCVPPAVVAGSNAVGGSRRDADYKTQCRNGEDQGPLLHVGFSIFSVVSSSWKSPRRHCPVQKTPLCSRISGTSISPLHARRWSRRAQTSSRISRNDIGRSAWLKPSK